MRIVLLGPPGSGKGTQAKQVASQYRIPHVTTASALADIARADSDLGRMVKETIEVNRVSDDLLTAVLRVRLSQPDAANGFVLDGFPRTVPQAETLEAVLDGIGRPVDVVILIDVDPDELMERLVGQLTCEGCGTVYNAYANPPTVDGVCDRCGGRVSRRPDDYEETIGNRLRIFESQTAQLMQHFKLRGKLRRVSGEGDPDKVFAEIRHILDATPRTVIEMEPVAEKAEPISVLPSGLPLPAPRKKAKAPAKPVRSAPVPPKPVAAAAASPPAPAKPAKAEAPAKPAVAKVSRIAAPPPAKRPAGKAAAAAASPKPAAQAPAATKTAKPAKAASGKKVAAKKPVPKKAAAKPVPKGAPAKARPGRAETRKPVPKKATPKKAAPKKATPKKAAPKKAITKKATSKKATPRKAAVSRTPSRKPVARKAAAKRPAANKPAAKRAVPKKAPARAAKGARR